MLELADWDPLQAAISAPGDAVPKARLAWGWEVVSPFSLQFLMTSRWLTEMLSCASPAMPTALNVSIALPFQTLTSAKFTTGAASTDA